MEEVIQLTQSDVIQYLPTLSDIVSQFKRTPGGKAYGEGLVAGKLLRHHFEFLAPFYYPLYFKSFVRVCPPVQWKGGFLHNLFKGAGSMSNISNYRDITIADDDGKAGARCVRPQLLEHAAGVAGVHQFGAGMNGGETCFPHL